MRNNGYWQLIEYTDLCKLWDMQVPLRTKPFNGRVYIRLSPLKGYNKYRLYKRAGGQFAESFNELKAPFVLVQGVYKINQA